MDEYKSDYLQIDKVGNTLVQKWSDKPLTVDDYKTEMYNFLHFFKKVKPVGLLWDNRNCNLIIPEELHDWMEQEILIPIYQKGVKKLIFTIPEIVPVHLSIINSLEKAKSILHPIYFSDRNEAELYVTDRKKVDLEEKLRIIDCQPNKNKLSFDLNINVSSNDLPKVLSYLRDLELNNQFIKLNQGKYESLTVQELKVFRLIALGYTNKQVADNLFIEESSVKTHRKKIKQKLGIKSYFDIYQYARSFYLFE